MAQSDPKLSLSDEARAEQYQGPRSRIEIVADEMPADLRAEFVVAVNDRTIPATGLARALKRRGFDVGSNSISHFRRTKGPMT